MELDVVIGLAIAFAFGFAAGYGLHALRHGRRRRRYFA
jgi:hypothetical protein